jgi:hypothetical protein
LKRTSGLRPFGIRSGEERAKLAALRAAEQRGALRTDCLHHGADIVHLRLEREDTRPVGEPGAALVEEDQP